MHKAVARLLEAEMVTKITVNLLAKSANNTAGFLPYRLHPNLSIGFTVVRDSTHPKIGAGRTIHIQYEGDHLNGTPDQAGLAEKNRCMIISAISKAIAGRYAAVTLDYCALKGGRLVGSGYFSWKGVGASLGGDRAKVVARLYDFILSRMGLGNIPHPDESKYAALFKAAGVASEDTGSGEPTKDPEIIPGKPELNPAAKVLTAAGMDLKTKSDLPTSLPKIPTDLNHQSILQKALDDLRDAGVIDYEIHYQNGKIAGVTVVKEGVDKAKKVAIIETMKNSDLISTALPNNAGFKVVCEGTTFIARTMGDICAVDAKGVERMVGEWDGKSSLATTIRALGRKIKATSITEAVQDYCGVING